MNKKVVAVGFSCVDIYEKLDKLYPSGNGIDWGIHLRRMGIDVSVVSAIGNDLYGDKMKAFLLSEGLEISHLNTLQGETCKMMMDLKNGSDRVHLQEIEGVMKDFSLTSEDIEFIQQFDYMHTDLFGHVLKDLKTIHESGVKIIMDFSTFWGQEEFQASTCFPYVDYAFLSYDKEDEYLLNFLKRMHKQGASLITATLGELGSITYDGKQFYRCGIESTNVVNTVGAGDSYIAGFTYGLIHGYDILKCMKTGAHISAKVVSMFEPY